MELSGKFTWNSLVIFLVSSDLSFHLNDLLGRWTDLFPSKDEALSYSTICSLHSTIYSLHSDAVSLNFDAVSLHSDEASWNFDAVFLHSDGVFTHSNGYTQSLKGAVLAL